jgi:hypothetical protein
VNSVRDNIKPLQGLCRWPLVLGLLVMTGCQSAFWPPARPLPSTSTVGWFSRAPRLPDREQLKLENIEIHSDFRLPQQHRMFDDLVMRQQEVIRDLKLPDSEEVLHIYLFDSPPAYHRYLRTVAPDLSDRRAVFIKTDIDLAVIAHWNSRVADDLRHEATHGFLHRVTPRIPLWMDEGLAEYYEVDRSQDGLNRPHVYLLANEFREGRWHPNLERLERWENVADFQQPEYAEAWLWIHFLRNHSETSRQLIPDYLAELRSSNPPAAFSQRVFANFPDAPVKLLEHLEKLAREL